MMLCQNFLGKLFFILILLFPLFINLFPMNASLPFIVLVHCWQLLHCHDTVLICRWNVSAGAARPNPQGSFKYGDITVTEVFVILNRPAELIDRKWRTTLNGISYLAPSTPLKLAQQFNVLGVYKLDFPNRLMNRPPKVDTSVINGTYKGFFEIIFQNNDSSVQNYHMDGYAFFVVG